MGSIAISSDSLPGFTSDYNVVVNLFSTNGGNHSESLAKWQTSTGQDKHSFLSTPSAPFVSEATNDYHLSSTSPTIDTGTSLKASSTDHDGNPHPYAKGYDIGAYEYQGRNNAVVVDAGSPGYNQTGACTTTTGGYSGTTLRLLHAAGDLGGGLDPGDQRHLLYLRWLDAAGDGGD
jgi:hypothetical protein